MTTAVEGAFGSLILRALVPLAAAFFLLSFLRSLNAVLSPYLIDDLALSAQSLGLLTSVYLFSSAIFQAPLGLLLDRFGPRRVQGTLMAVATAGTLMFALSSNLGVLIAGRAIMGLGAAGALMTCFQATVLWFPPARWPALNGWVMATGGLGTLVATVPAALVLHLTSWRGLMLIVAALSVAGSLAIFAFVPEHADTGRGRGIGEQLRGFAVIFRDRLFWRLAPVFMAVAGANLAFTGLWAGPWLKDVGGEGPDGIALSLLFLTALTIIGFLVTGAVGSWIARHGISLTRVLGATMLASMLLQLPLLWPNASGQWVVMFAIGTFGTVTVLAYPLLNAHFPASFSGRVSTALNLFFFVGAFLIQYAMGVVIDLFPQVAPGTYPPLAYQTAFGAMLLIQLASWLWFLVPVRAEAPKG